MNWSALRVFNDDIVQPHTGFDMHPHRDMEIVTYIIDGELSHADSVGNAGSIRPGEVQVMSAGTGILHSEKNDSSAPCICFSSGSCPGTREIRRAGHKGSSRGTSALANCCRW
jgi:redox-sensitive bicupin YhaK (pirin superfamily)